MKKVRVYAPLGIALAAAAAFSWSLAASAGENQPKSEAARTAEIGKPAPDFNLKDAYGKAFTLSEFKGKIVVLEWMNPGCPVSRGKQVDQVMQKTYAKYAAKGVVWLGVDSTAGQKAEANRVYAAETGLNYPVLLDPDGKVGHAFVATKTPHLFVIDKTGKLVYAGAIDDQGEKNFVGAAVEDLLAGREVAKSRTEAYGCTVKYAR
ncbi:MAG TPA: redoxin domain-containing protein [Phycisphaerae bacterium]|nr:redoxin domain-containing protein [Phycisphaerae bacterium]HRY69836.1 redoxin domain-containing protein [Phycisphaerae bacterium]HSA25437.1 redoxin domain-containing protein [Phycisphaerae bacterium]